MVPRVVHARLPEDIAMHASSVGIEILTRGEKKMENRRCRALDHSGKAITVKMRSAIYPNPPLTFHWILMVYVPALTEGWQKL